MFHFQKSLGQQIHKSDQSFEHEHDLNSAECGLVKSSRAELDSRRFIGNNKVLLQTLTQHGLTLPDDYFDKINGKGLYNGREITFEEVLSGKYEKSGLENIELSKGGSTTTIYYLPVHIWNHKNSEGYGAFSNTEMYEILEETFRLFRLNGGRIEFYIKEITYPNNSPYYNLANNQARDNMFNAYHDAIALNFHFVNDAPSSGSASFPGNELYVSNGIQYATLAHEIGHNLGVDHTHAGRTASCEDNNANCSNCYQEPVSRSMGQPLACGNFGNSKKCELNGDKLCDTPGERKLSNLLVDNICIYTGGGTDNWGVSWVPNTRNIMSYSRKTCRTQFSFGQVVVMLDELQTNKFNFKSTTPNFTISGATKVCPGVTYTYSMPEQPGVVHYLWQVPDGWTLTGQGSRTVTIIPIQNYVDHTIYVNPIRGGFVAPLKVTVDDLSIAISGSSEIPDDAYCRAYSAEFYGNSSYSWSTSAPLGSGVEICTGHGTNNITFRAAPNSPDFYLNVAATNVCGITAYGSKFITIGNDGSPPISITPLEIDLFPNPTDGVLTIMAKQDNEYNNLKIIDMVSGKIILQKESLEYCEKLSIMLEKKGIYLVQYQANQQMFTHKIIRK